MINLVLMYIKIFKSKEKERDYVKEAMIGFNLETKMRDAVKTLVHPYLERENYICNETERMKIKFEKIEKKILNMDLLEDRILYLERITTSINNRLTIWDNDFHLEKSNTATRFESQMLFNAEIQSNINTINSNMHDLSFKLSTFSDDLQILSQKYLETKSEVMENIVEIRHNTNFEIEGLKEQAREFEKQLNTTTALDENNKNTLLDICSDLEMLKLEFTKMKTTFSSATSNNLLRPEFESKIQQFNLDMELFNSKVTKIGSEMNKLHEKESKALLDAVSLINLGLTYISQPLSSTKNALLSLFSSTSSGNPSTLNSLSKMVSLMCETADKGLKEKQSIAERDLELRKSEIERHRKIEKDQFDQLQQWAYDKIKDEVKRSLEAEYAQFKEESEKGEAKMHDSESEEDEEMKRIDQETPNNNYVELITSQGNPTPISEYIDKNENNKQSTQKESKSISPIDISIIMSQEGSYKTVSIQLKI